MPPVDQTPPQSPAATSPDASPETSPEPVIDLGTIRPSPAGAAGASGTGGSGGGSPISVGSPVNLDRTRQTLAFILLGILAAIIVVEVLASAIFAASCWFQFDGRGGNCQAAQSALSLLTTPLGTVFTAMVGLVGSVVGFYFGSQKQT